MPTAALGLRFGRARARAAAWGLLERCRLRHEGNARGLQFWLGLRARRKSGLQGLALVFAHNFAELRDHMVPTGVADRGALLHQLLMFILAWRAAACSQRHADRHISINTKR